MSNERYFGAHVSASGGYHEALARGETLGVNTIQIHPSAPQKWNSKPYSSGLEEQFLLRKKNSSVKKVFFHGIYLLNLATPKESHRELSKLSLIHDLELAERMEADGVIFHVGSLKDEPDEEIGFRRAAEALNDIFERTSAKVPLLMEVSAGSGKVVGDRFEELVQIYSQVNAKERVGFALDTQHMWASGYQLDVALEEILESLHTQVGIDKIKAIHLNDSKSDCGSRIDRHENLGLGKIGEDVLKRIVQHAALREIPFILETPCLKSLEEASRDVGILQTWCEEL